VRGGRAKCPKPYALPVSPPYACFIYGYPRFKKVHP
jgi:hypothetical protein